MYYFSQYSYVNRYGGWKAVNTVIVSGLCRFSESMSSFRNYYYYSQACRRLCSVGERCPLKYRLRPHLSVPFGALHGVYFRPEDPALFSYSHNASSFSFLLQLFPLFPILFPFSSRFLSSHLLN